MRIRSIIIQRKYLFKIYFIVTSAMFSLIVAFSGIIYYQEGNSLVSEEINNGKKILIQMANNIRNIDDIVRSICLSNFYSDDVKALMYLKEKDSYIEINTLQRLQRSVITTNFFIRSVYVYNNIRKIYFSTSNPTHSDDKFLQEKIKSLPSVPVLKPVLRNIQEMDANGSIKIEKVISYFFYDQTDPNKDLNGAVIVNINLDWLFSSIKEVSAVDKDRDDMIILMDNSGELINEESMGNKLPNGITDLLKSFKTDVVSNQDNNNIQISTKILDGKKYLFTYTKLAHSEWTLFKIREYDDIYIVINSFRTLIILLTAGFILLVLVATLAISGFIYRPVADIFNQVKKDYKVGKEWDEISLIKDSINSSKEKLNKLYIERNSNFRIVKAYFLMRLLIESAVFKKDEILSFFNEHCITLTPDGFFSVCVLKIDKYHAFREKHDEKTRKIMKFAVSNIVHETISSVFNCEITEDTQEDQIVIILNVPIQETDFYQQMECLLEQAGKYVLEYYGFSFYASASQIFGSYTEITQMYQKASSNLAYHYILGLRGLITPRKVLQNEKNSGRYNLDTEIKLLGLIKDGDILQAEKMLTVLFDELREGNSKDVMFYTTHLINALRNLICEINKDRQEPINVNSILPADDLQMLGTLEELYGRIIDVLAKLKKDSDNITTEKRKVIADTIKDIIHSNYHQSVLGASYIADMLRLTPTYIGRLFNEYTNMSLPEYINEVRMGKALEWLQNSKLSVEEVMYKVGIENRGYFYKLFKNKYGSSPREFINR